MEEPSAGEPTSRSFAATRDELLYLIVLDNVSESSGDLRCPTGRFALLDMSSTRWRGMVERYRQTGASLGITDPMSFLSGNYLVVEHTNGQVEVEAFDQSADLVSAYEDLEDRYGRWMLEQLGSSGQDL